MIPYWSLLSSRRWPGPTKEPKIWSAASLIVMGRPKAGSSPPTKKPISCRCPIDSTVPIAGGWRWQNVTRNFSSSFKFSRKIPQFFFPESEPMMPMEWLKLPSEHNNKVAKIRTECGTSGILLDLFHLTYCTKWCTHIHPNATNKMLDTLQIQTVIYKLHKLSPPNCSTTVNSQGLRDYLVAEIVSTRAPARNPAACRVHNRSLANPNILRKWYNHAI